jgi:GT2 family glycosyltransferase
MTDISVIVLDVDGGDMLRTCLDSIAAQTVPPREVIVFDNGSRTPVASRIGFRPGLHVLRSETNLGFAGGNNEAYRHATGTYVALINNDVVLDRDWLATVAAALYRREALGATIFEARLFAYYEDVDLCARLHESGWRTEVLPVIKATHAGSQSAPLLGGDALRLRTRNRYFVARRHRGVGRIGALLLEDVKLALRGRTSIRGVWQGLFTR